MFALPAFGFAQKAAESPYTDPRKLAELIERRNDEGAVRYYLVDVRTLAEYREGHIPTAANIPVGDIGSRPPTSGKTDLVILYCRSGSRSATAKQLLERLGYTNVVNFGAVSRWAGSLVPGDKPTLS